MWIAIGAVGILLVGFSYPRVFPFAPSEWRLSRGEAIDLAVERIERLGPSANRPYVVANFQTDPALEMRLRRSLSPLAVVKLRESRLAQALSTWVVRVYPPEAEPGEWSHRVEVSPSGQVLALQRGETAAITSGVELGFDEAVRRATDFLAGLGIELESYEGPMERRLDRPDRRDLVLRYRDREALLGAEFGYGVEIRFAGDQLVGFYSWHEDPEAAELALPLRRVQLAQTAWLFVSFVLLPVLAVIFVRRYHEGLVGVRRGGQIFVLILACYAVVLAMTLGPSSEGNAASNLTRQQMTWVWAAFVALVYLPSLALLGFFGWSVGESLCPEAWRNKLSAFDALFRRRWTSSTVAAASLRGVGAGLLHAGVLLAVPLALAPWGVWAPFSLLLGPWWENAAWPGVTLLLLQAGFVLSQGLFSLLLLLPPLVARLGRWLGGGLVAVASGLIFAPALVIEPLPLGAVLAVASAAVAVVLFLSFDLLTALLASLVPHVVLAAWPLINATSPFIQLQGCLAALGAALPLWVSARSLLSDRPFYYEHDDVPPHVRRIRQRERQRVELETARRIQASILPQLPSQLGGLQVAHTYLPANEVGGDFYDAVRLTDGRLALAIGDVAGHGVSSGLVMSMARSALRVQVDFSPEVGEVFKTLNRIIYEYAGRRLLCTLSYALLDPVGKSLLYASAGHIFPYRVSSTGSIVALESIAYPLGVRPEIEVSARCTSLVPGDALFFSSDGLVEARADGDEVFGFERLEASLARHSGTGAQGLRDGVLEDLSSFVGDGRIDPKSDLREDDLTILVLSLPV